MVALEQAYAKADLNALKSLSRKAAKQIDNHPVSSLKEGFESVISSPMHFEVQYGSKSLASNLVLPRGNEYGAIAFAYNGGNINMDDFKFIQYHKHDSEQVDYRTLLIVVPPELSDIERRALDAIPIDQDFVNIGDATICPGATIALVAIVVALVTQAGRWEEMASRLDKVRLSEDQLNRLGPLASARELVAVRREIFEQYGL